jgi:hypothetical protein
MTDSAERAGPPDDAAPIQDVFIHGRVERMRIRAVAKSSALLQLVNPLDRMRAPAR